MPNIARLGDKCSGHGCFPPRPNIQASSNVFVNGIGVHREGDGYATHCCGPSCHTSTLAVGSQKVFVNGKGVGRIADPVACGSAIAQGSANVFSG
jgi:uncharacterized Zn-binding protein involved in type VI secretion